MSTSPGPCLFPSLKSGEELVITLEEERDVLANSLEFCRYDVAPTEPPTRYDGERNPHVL